MAQNSESSEQKNLKFQSKQMKLGFILLGLGIVLQWVPWGAPWSFLLGWTIAATGTLFCAKTMLGNFGWCLLSLFPMVGAMLAIIGILLQHMWNGNSSDNRRYFRIHEFLIILIAMVIFWGCFAYIRFFCIQNGGCSFG